MFVTLKGILGIKNHGRIDQNAAAPFLILKDLLTLLSPAHFFQGQIPWKKGGLVCYQL